MTWSQADYQRGEVRFTAPAAISQEVLADAIRRAGYQPGDVEAAQPAVWQPGPHAVQDEKGYDLAIAGSGGAAFAAAIKAREAGAHVVMIERGTLGGTCVNTGCVPSKTLLRGGELYYQAGHHPFAGIETCPGTVDLAALGTQKDELVQRLRREKYADLVAEYGWDLVRGEASFLDER
ncbi:MAG: FAD-dependent oxidoreductase, partial [Chloroflexi bacterium]|nr:FAD-dependent oxidoreductase [Chloroflexota bacterium]